MNQIERTLKRYLETETLLNEFFASFDYCLKECVGPAITENGNQPVAACCKNRYHVVCDLDHPVYDRLRQEREKRFGKPEEHSWENPVSPCEYHNPQRGCILFTHKSPICLAFLCRKGIDRLRERFGIYTYDYLGFYYALEWLLTGDLPESQFQDFTRSIHDMINKLKVSYPG
jgi:hypothetical protein